MSGLEPVFQGDWLRILCVSERYSYLRVCRYKALKRAASLREQLFKTMRRFDVTLVSTRDQETVLKCIVSGLFTNAAYLHHSGEYRDVLFNWLYFLCIESILKSQLTYNVN